MSTTTDIAVPPLYPPALIEELAERFSTLRGVVDWMKDYLARPHDQLGRAGPVCPVVPKALRFELISLAVVPSTASSAYELLPTVLAYRQMFLNGQPQGGPESLDKAIVLVFPRLQPSLVDQVQSTLKAQFVADGLMIGEFHKLNESPGLHNDAFRPLRSPVPLLAIRHMVESDLPFLSRSDDAAPLRASFLRAYLDRFESTALSERVDHARAALALAQAEMMQ